MSSTETTSRALTPTFHDGALGDLPHQRGRQRAHGHNAQGVHAERESVLPGVKPQDFLQHKVEPEIYEKSAPNAKHMVSENPMYRRILNTFGISEYTLSAVPW